MIRYQFLRFPQGKSKAVTLSYDDGPCQDIRFSKVLNNYGLKCTFNLNSSSLGQTRMTTDEVVEHILKPGHEVAVHGHFHRASGTLRPIEGIREVLDNRMELEQTFEMIIRGMAYPDSGIRHFANGANYECIRNYLKELDIAYARTLGGDNDLFEIPRDWYAWMPTAHHNNPQILDYIDKFVNIDLEDSSLYIDSRRPCLFYMWGHSYEFDEYDNWEHLDVICKKISRKEDIWYATNMEIYNYVTAYNSLVYSADGTRVYNPSLYTIWFDVDRKLYAIRPGETIVCENIL